MARVRERTIPTERPQLVGEVSANFYGLEGATTITILDVIHRPVFYFKTQHITSPLWAKQFNAIYRFETMVH
jgi:hypothetical protein